MPIGMVSGTLAHSGSASSTATATIAPVATPTPKAAASRLPRTFTRAEIAQRIANGDTLVLHRRKVYKLDKWLDRHPGGELAILHFVGRDATDEIEAYHSDHTLNTLMSRFVIGYLDEREWESYRPLVPPVQLGYRKGKLDHPHAQIGMWTGRAPSAALESRTATAAEDDETDSDSEVAELLGAKRLGTPSKSTEVKATQISRPQTFPLPVEMLEPPADLPSMDPARERAISQAYKKMHEEVKAAGLYELRPSGYARECVRYVLLAATAWYFLRLGHAQHQLESDSTMPDRTFLGLARSTISFFISSVFLGLFWHQLTFTAHDSGHSGITHSHSVDRLIGIAIADFIGGLSIGWWCNNHDVHHLVTNHPEHDPDIQHMPFFAISPKFVLAAETAYLTEGGVGVQQGPDEKKSTAAPSPGPARPLGLWSSYYRRVLEFDAPSRFFLRFQHQLYYIVMSLGRFNLYANSYGFLLLKAQRNVWLAIEVAGLVFYWTWYGALLLGGLPSWGTRLSYLLVSHMVTSPLHVQIVLSHFAQSTEDLGLSESFASRQIRTTMDVECPTWLDFVHGGLHMQVSHHLFPRVPRHNLREVRDGFVKPFCDTWGLKYEEYGFVRGNGRVLDTLRSVAGQVEVLAKVAEAKARGELH